MTQVSRHKLQPEMSDLIYQEFSMFISKIPSANSVHQFFNDFLTTTEKVMLSKRYMIMVFLMRGYTTEQIKNKLYVSNSAVMSVSSWLKNASPATRQSLKELNTDIYFNKLLDNIENILDKLPPGKYRDWHQVGKDKIVRLKARQLRSKIR